MTWICIFLINANRVQHQWRKKWTATGPDCHWLWRQWLQRLHLWNGQSRASTQPTFKHWNLGSKPGQTWRCWRSPWSRRCGLWSCRALHQVKCRALSKWISSSHLHVTNVLYEITHILTANSFRIIYFSHDVIIYAEDETYFVLKENVWVSSSEAVKAIKCKRLIASTQGHEKSLEKSFVSTFFLIL